MSKGGRKECRQEHKGKKRKKKRLKERGVDLVALDPTRFSEELRPLFS